MRTLNIPAVFESDADDLTKSRKASKQIHATGDIRAAGDEVEQPAREYFQRMLPSKYYVTHGHIIDRNSTVSPQIDLIIADNKQLPSLLKTKDGTEYVPIESVYAIGEIKSTYYKNSEYIETFSDTIRILRDEFVNEAIPNTAHEGVTGETLMRDTVLTHGNRILNQLFAFVLCVDCGDFEFSEAVEIYNERDIKHLPNITVLLNKGIVHRGKLTDERFNVNRYPEWPQDEGEEWFMCTYHGDESQSGSLAGNHLGFLYYAILQHLTCSLLEPPPLWKYMREMMVGRRSTLETQNTK